MRLGATAMRYLYCGENRHTLGTAGNRTLGTQPMARHFFDSHLGSHKSMYGAGNQKCLKTCAKDRSSVFRSAGTSKKAYLESDRGYNVCTNFSLLHNDRNYSTPEAAEGPVLKRRTLRSITHWPEVHGTE